MDRRGAGVGPPDRRIRLAEDAQCFGLVTGGLQVLRGEVRRVDEPLAGRVLQTAAATEEDQPPDVGQRERLQQSLGAARQQPVRALESGDHSVVPSDGLP